MSTVLNVCISLNVLFLVAASSNERNKALQQDQSSKQYVCLLILKLLKLVSIALTGYQRRVQILNPLKYINYKRLVSSSPSITSFWFDPGSTRIS